jgi:hypothetical protein
MVQVHAAMGLYIVVVGDGGAEVVGRLVVILLLLLLLLLLLVTLVTVHRVTMMGPIVGLKSTEKETEGQVLEKGGREAWVREGWRERRRTTFGNEGSFRKRTFVPGLSDQTSCDMIGFF